MLEKLPVLNACLNAVAAVLLFCGWRRIRRGDVAGHKRFMLSAFAVSTLFLISYVTYHGLHGHTTFRHEGLPRIIYLSVLATHVPLAALMVVPILLLLFLALTGRFQRHRRLARIVLPVWLYVSVTGVAVYVMLYHLWP